jgi:DNA-binding NarL/FixJ family response regulator
VKGKPLTAAQKRRIVALHKKGLNRKEVAARTGLCTQTVRDALRERGVLVPYKPRVSLVEVGEMRRLYEEEGLPLYKVGERLGRAERTVKEKLEAAGVALRQQAIPEEVCAEMERLYVEERLTQAQVGERTGHHESIVGIVLRRRKVKTRGKLDYYRRRRIRELWREGLTVVAIAEQTGHTQGTVSRVLHAVKIDTSKGRPVTMPERQQMVRLYESGMKLRQVAETLGRPQGTILDQLHAVGVQVRGHVTPSEAERAEMVRLYVQERRSMSEVAKVIGWSFTTVHRVLHESGAPIRRPHRTLRPHPNQVPHAEMRRTVETYREAGSIAEAARRLGMKEATVRNRLHAAGEPITRRPANVKSPNQTPPEKEREVIRLYVEEGWSQKQVREHFGLAHRTFTNILQRNGVEKLSRSEAQRRWAAQKRAMQPASG